jgi:hypothetical protein
MNVARQITTTLKGAVRLNNTVNGNPRFDLITADGDFMISSDSACSYDVENFVGRIRHGEDRVTLSLTRAGRVWNIKRA